MANPREIRRRIRAVNNTRQITRAMELVARTKMHHTRQQVRAARPYNEHLTELLWRLAEAGDIDSAKLPLLESRPVQRTLVICFSADRGLCGGYNANILRRTEAELRQVGEAVETRLVTVGKRARDFFRWKGYDIYDQFINIGEEADLELARNIGRIAVREFLSERVDEVRLVYTRFESIFSHPTEVQRLLPIRRETGGPQDAPGELYHLHEPSAVEIFSLLVPRYVDNTVYKVLTEAKASEHAARVTAMKNATDNAGELIEELTRQFNRARQTVITREITEIASGAEALARER